MIDRVVDAVGVFRQGAIGDLRLLECPQMVELGNQFSEASRTMFDMIAAGEIQAVTSTAALDELERRSIL